MSCTMSYQEKRIADEHFRRLKSFPFQMLRLGTGNLEQCLKEYCDSEYLGEPYSSDLQVERDFYSANAHLLRRGNAEWPAQRILLQLALEHADNSPLTVAAQQWVAEGRCTWPILYHPQRPAEVVPGSTVAVLEGTGLGSSGAGFCPNGDIIIFFTDRVQLWRIDGLKLGEQKNEMYVKGATGLRDGRVLVWFLDGSASIWDGSAFLPLFAGQEFKGVSGMVELDDGRLVTSSAESPCMARKPNGWPINSFAVLAAWGRVALYKLLEMVGVDSGSSLVQEEAIPTFDFAYQRSFGVFRHPDGLLVSKLYGLPVVVWREDEKPPMLLLGRKGGHFWREHQKMRDLLGLRSELEKALDEAKQEIVGEEFSVNPGPDFSVEYAIHLPGEAGQPEAVWQSTVACQLQQLHPDGRVEVLLDTGETVFLARQFPSTHVA
jgi:hypothetical protein